MLWALRVLGLAFRVSDSGVYPQVAIGSCCSSTVGYRMATILPANELQFEV